MAAVTFAENLNGIPFMMAEQWHEWGHHAYLVARGSGLIYPYCALAGAHAQKKNPPWVTLIEGRSRALHNRARGLLAMRRASEKIGLPVISSGGRSVMFYRSKIPLAVWCHGSELLTIPFRLWPRYSYLRIPMRAILRQARLVISNQPDHAGAIRRLGLSRKARYVPTPISCAFWRRAAAPPAGPAFRVLAPATHDYWHKGTDRIIRGFARFARERPPGRPALMTMRAFGKDVARSKRLIRRLGIAKNVTFREQIPTERQPADMEAHHCVIDSVARGIIGMTGLEAMAMGRPLICHAPESHYARHYEVGDMPPLFEAQTDADITRQLRAISDMGPSAAFGRTWVQKYHDAPVVARRLLEITEDFAR